MKDFSNPIIEIIRVDSLEILTTSGGFPVFDGSSSGDRGGGDVFDPGEILAPGGYFDWDSEF